MSIKAPLPAAKCGVQEPRCIKMCLLAAHSWEGAALNSAVVRALTWLGEASVSVPCPKVQACISFLQEGSRIEHAFSVQSLKIAFSVSFPTILKH